MTAKKNEPILWTGHDDEDGNLVIDWSEPLGENLRRGKQERREEEARFRGAPFPLYGLPPEWSGDRRLGGGEWSEASALHREVVRALSLVHGSNIWGRGPSLAVETAAPDPSRGGSELRCIAGWLWFGGARSVEEAQDADRHVWGEEQQAPQPVLVRREVTLRMKDRAVAFDSLWRDAEWVAYAEVNGHHITVEGSEFDPGQVELVRITDVEPYIEGGH